ncbi:CBS domain-containing protein [Candidatus Woesearchaeota archaeon]|nr:CBS domain-containing protein [Candidatus Woesearchaeota archaeon]
MVFELGEIKKIRKKLGMSQAELAKRADVSQSMIAKIEAGKLEPGYTAAQRILQALQEMNQKQELKARAIMNPKLISIRVSDSIKQAIAKMQKYAISQLPVVERGQIIGLVTEGALLNATQVKKFSLDSAVAEVMEDTPPIVSQETPLTVIVQLLKFFPMVMVAEKGKWLGVITKADIVKKSFTG